MLHVGHIGLAILAGLLSIAVWHDVHAHRIPNWLVFSGAALGLLLHTLLPSGDGFLAEAYGGIGFGSALTGLGVGLAILLPMYMLRAMGAGDVKLMAMVGAFLGAGHTLGAALFSLLAGGVLAIAVALGAGVFKRMLVNIQTMFYVNVGRIYLREKPDFGDGPASAGKLPYAVAIGLGTAIYLAAAINGWWLV